jgi:hypothetical protein
MTRLLPGSPAVDAGSNRRPPAWDQRGPGYPRIVNGTMDIGAFEVQGTTAPSALVTAAVLTPAPARPPQASHPVAWHRQGLEPPVVVVPQARETVSPPADVPHARAEATELNPDLFNLGWL